jgi:hypothetical protein
MRSSSSRPKQYRELVELLTEGARQYVGYPSSSSPAAGSPTSSAGASSSLLFLSTAVDLGRFFRAPTCTRRSCGSKPGARRSKPSSSASRPCSGPGTGSSATASSSPGWSRAESGAWMLSAGRCGGDSPRAARNGRLHLLPVVRPRRRAGRRPPSRIRVPKPGRPDRASLPRGLADRSALPVKELRLSARARSGFPRAARVGRTSAGARYPASRRAPPAVGRSTRPGSLPRPRGPA